MRSSIGMMRFPIVMGKCQKWPPVPTNQIYHSVDLASVMTPPDILMRKDTLLCCLQTLDADASTPTLAAKKSH